MKTCFSVEQRKKKLRSLDVLMLNCKHKKVHFRFFFFTKKSFIFERKIYWKYWKYIYNFAITFVTMKCVTRIKYILLGTSIGIQQCIVVKKKKTFFFSVSYAIIDDNILFFLLSSWWQCHTDSLCMRNQFCIL